MNNTKNDKYLRKNRHDKNSKHKYKNKTRKVQRGGKAFGITTGDLTTIVRGIRENQAAPATEEEHVERLKQEADDKKKMAEHSDPRFSLLAQTFPNWIMGKVSSVGHDSQVKLGEEIILTEFLTNIGNHIKQTKNQIKEVEYFNELLLTAIRELNEKKTDMSNDDLDKFNLYMRQIDYNNMFINKTLSDVRTTYEGAIKSGVLQPMPEKSSSPGFFDKKKNTPKGKQKVPNEQNETPENEKPSITQRFKQGVSNMGKTVKNAATSAKGAIMRITKKNNKVSPVSPEIEMQELPQNPGGNDGSQSSTVSRPPVPPRQPAPTTPQAAGGNKTRKNGQYIREIKENRNELFNKEMEIINSIRNFKHGHIHEPKKQFINVIKRS
jgi:hypothetical protein